MIQPGVFLFFSSPWGRSTHLCIPHQLGLDRGVYRMIDPTAIIRLVAQHRQDWRFGVEQLAEELQVSPSYLREMVIIHFHMTPRRFIETARMELALDFLRTESCVYRVSRLSGYNCVRSFRRTFRIHIGMTPSAFLRLTKMEQNKVAQARITIKFAPPGTQADEAAMPTCWPWPLTAKL
jgi:AraC-like DNA-binding protein